MGHDLSNDVSHIITDGTELLNRDDPGTDATTNIGLHAFQRPFDTFDRLDEGLGADSLHESRYPLYSTLSPTFNSYPIQSTPYAADPHTFEYDVNPVFHAPFLRHEGLNYGYDHIPSSTSIEEHTQSSWYTNGTYVDHFPEYAVDWTSGPSQPRLAPDSIDKGSVPDTVLCSHPGCSATFTGTYRRGNLARHLRSTHVTDKHAMYHCEADLCPKVFHRQDARMKHYRSHHPHLHSELGIRREARGSSAYTETRDEASNEQSQGEQDPVFNFDIRSHRNLSLEARVTDSGLYETASLANLFPDSENHDQYVSASELHSPPSIFGNEHMVDDTLFACSFPLCNSTFQRPADLRRHMQKHEEPTFQCEISSCARQFYRLDKLRDHVRRAHKGSISTSGEGSLQFEISAEEAAAKPLYHTCTQCGAVFKRMVDLNDHINRKHNRRFHCPICNSAFHLRADLNRHLTIHNNRHSEAIKVHHCPNSACYQSFSRKDNLLRHMKRCDKTTEAEAT
jgi:uncharacterized Zn-finger protein